MRQTADARPSIIKAILLPRRCRTAAATLLTVLAAHTVLGIGAEVSFAGTGPRAEPSQVTLNLSDDDSREMPLPFSFTMCGRPYDSVWVNSNGNLTFGTGDWRFSESAEEFLAGPPRVAAKWDDLNPATGGRIAYQSGTNSVIVTFENVPNYYAAGSNTFAITLHRGSNHVEVAYGDVIPGPDNDGLAGMSCGAPLTTGDESETDLSAGTSAVDKAGGAGAIYEAFTADDFDLSNATLRVIGLKQSR